ncbi:SusC/RagA family TonB-linked outer membrane protein [Paradesertivirga mongoliensis]|uniref:SusC/RagA family TonB-linked outer membrane protein n=1 Tax=Paradesertivirga mongoliensis TaxID=2100740 RepID=A0ABW4ZKT6_9SPHI|nr:SusC/RagA family TonB-linked outer membrane protein [Pedobacter mongoliensis]
MMKYSKIAIVLCVLFTLFASVLRAQDAVKISVKATVKGPAGEIIKGASVVNETNNISVVTDQSGSFTVEVPTDAVLMVTAPGYKPSLIVATSDLTEISLAKDVRSVQVAFKQIDEADLPAGVSNVDVASLLEDNYFTYTLDGMDALAPGFNGNGIWGLTGVMILVDGIPRSVESVTPNEVDQITFLKSAPAVALYGSRGARGVILITTKRGIEGKQKINVRTNAGVNVPKRFPSYLGSSEYMTLYNEALMNDATPGVTPNGLFTNTEIYNHSGINPYRYPDVDFYSSDYLKSSFGRYDAVTEIYGGNERARYYSNIGFNSSGSLLNFGEAKKNNTSDRFNIRGNVDMQLTRAIKARVDATAAFSTGRGINTDYFGGASTIRPNRFVPLIPLSFIEETDSPSWAVVSSANIIDGKYLAGGTSVDQTNPIAAGYLGGTNGYVQREFQFTTGIDADLKGILEGLTFSTTFGQDYYNRYNQGYRNGYATYQANWTDYSGKDVIGSLSAPFGLDSRNGEQVIADSYYRQTTSISSQFNYNTSISNKHNISAILMGTAYRVLFSQEYQPEANSNLGLQLGYNLSKKYYVDFTGAFVRSAKYAPGKRTAFSPSASLGWRISEESFMKGSSIFDNLMLTASAGILHTDLDLNDYFLYQDIFIQPTNGTYYGWSDGSGYMSTDYRRGANPDLTFAKRKEVSIGLQGSMFKKQLAFGINAFRINNSDIPIQNNALFPNYFSQQFPVSSLVPYVNYNADLRTGLDFNINLKKRVGAVDLGLGTSATYYTTEATKRADKVVYLDEYQYRQGKPLDAVWGLESQGFYMDAVEAAAASSREDNGAVKPAYGEVRAGDIKYKDQNNDKVIDGKDYVYLGRGGWFGSPLTMGLNFTAKWKNFSVFALGTGRFGGIGMKNNNYFWVNGADKYSVVVRDRWTEETKNTATFPRLTTTAGNNNFRDSDFWTYTTDRVDLSKVQVSYNFSQKLLKSKVVKELGVYVAGFNLLTVAKEKELLETNITTAPQTRLYNLGLKALF